MQPVERKTNGRNHPRLLLWLLPLGLLCLAGLIVAVIRLNKPAPYVPQGDVSGYGELVTRETTDVTSITVTLRSGETWTLCRNEAGDMELAGEKDFVLDSVMVRNAVDAASVISYDHILSQDPAEYQDRLADFGLDQPRCVASFTYSDGTSQTIRIGSKSDELDSTFYYMLSDGYPGLYALDITTANALTVEKGLLHAVTQPVIHQARIDRISFTTGDQVTTWELQGNITDADAEDRWMITSPTVYPAEGEKLSQLRSSMEGLRMGAYIGPATQERLTELGFDQPRFTMTIHMAAGTVGLIDDTGVYDPTDFAESTVTLTVGSAKSDMLDYVLFDHSIYTVAHFTMNVFMATGAIDTATRYPIRVSLSNLATLTVITDSETVLWQVSRTATTDEDGNILYDDDGTVLSDATVTRNGEAYSWDTFSAAYDNMVIATVSGVLPGGWTATEPAHTTFLFTTQTGTTHSLQLVPFDAMHDAVVCDGGALFYLIRDGLGWGI